jgi:hypothetical protein
LLFEILNEFAVFIFSKQFFEVYFFHEGGGREGDPRIHLIPPGYVPEDA